MYSDYMKEKHSLQLFKTYCGFVSYNISKFSNTFNIEDFYIKPEYRNTKEGTFLFYRVKEFAINSECKKMTCCIETKSNYVTPSLGAVISVGFKFSHIKDDLIYFYQNL